MNRLDKWCTHCVILGQYWCLRWPITFVWVFCCYLLTLLGRQNNTKIINYTIFEWAEILNNFNIRYVRPYSTCDHGIGRGIADRAIISLNSVSVRKRIVVWRELSQGVVNEWDYLSLHLHSHTSRLWKSWQRPAPPTKLAIYPKIQSQTVSNWHLCVWWYAV